MPRDVLVQYGRLAHIGRFTHAAELERGQPVVVRGPRGVEVGAVLAPLTDPARFPFDAVGEVLRVQTAADARLALEQHTQALELLAAADAAATRLDLPLTLVDCEWLLDGSAAILHALLWAECAADDWLAGLSATHGLPVRLLDLSRVPATVDAVEPAGKCGDGGCSTGGCGTGGGCSTGGCSRGKVKDAKELTAYFGRLRQQMEAEGLARVSLG